MDIITSATNAQIHEAAASVGHTVEFHRSENRTLHPVDKPFEFRATTEGLTRRELRAATTEVLAAIAAIAPDTLVYSRESQMDGGPAYVPVNAH